MVQSHRICHCVGRESQKSVPHHEGASELLQIWVARREQMNCKRWVRRQEEAGQFARMIPQLCAREASATMKSVIENAGEQEIDD